VQHGERREPARGAAPREMAHEHGATRGSGMAHRSEMTASCFLDTPPLASKICRTRSRHAKTLRPSLPTAAAATANTTTLTEQQAPTKGYPHPPDAQHP
jgi:hypothetical protein